MKAACVENQASDLKALLFFEAVTLLSGAAGGLLGGLAGFDSVNHPPLTPPAFLFPIVWCLLYLLTGFGAYLAWAADNIDGVHVLRLYLLQLLVNIFRSLFFIRLQWRLFSFFWTVFLIALVTLVMAGFKYIRKAAYFFMLPYLFWLLFTAYLNLGFYLVNM